MTELLMSIKFEFNKIKWPSKEQTKRLTAYVIGVSLGVGLFVTALDYLFNDLLARIIG